MIFERLINYFMTLFNLVITKFGLRDSDNIDIEIVYKSKDFIIVNKPEDIFTNNHNKAVSIILPPVYCNYIKKQLIIDTVMSALKNIGFL
jgi:hypothetical protein